MKYRAHVVVLTIALVVLTASSPLYAFDGDRVQLGRSITVGQNEEVGDVVCMAVRFVLMAPPPMQWPSAAG